MKLLRTFLLASALSLMLAPAAGAVEATSQTQVGDLISRMTIGLSNNKAGQSTKLHIHGSHELTTGAKQPQSQSLEMTTPKGTKVNASIVKTCDFTELKSTGSCPSNTRLGKGTAKIRVDTGGLGTLTVNDITAYKIANSNCDSGSKVCVAVHASEPVTGTVTDIVAALIGNPPKLVIHDFSLPTVLGIVPINIFTEVSVDKSKTVKKKKGGKTKKEKLYILTNPGKCPGTWDFAETRNYEGYGPVTTNPKVPCKKK